ncbi:MAG: 3-phosphoshikimate 1-carboxyvinyltransferase [Betaproteobacteria bacterium]|nr:3-phosphoshikimate 1-carboxyvinyltransferase [Betaproteobacteria bacterium]
MPAAEYLDLLPIPLARGSIRIPGSKSISNRVLLLSALATGPTEVCDVLESEDTGVMLGALTELGVSWHRTRTSILVTGTGGRIPSKSAELFLGNAGTAFRPLAAVLAFAGGSFRLSGVPRMHERPIADLVDALRPLGAEIHYLGQEGFPPLSIGPAHASAAHCTRIRGDVSSQFISALLMALPILGRDVEVLVAGELISKPYVEITLRLMRQFGVLVTRDGWKRFAVSAGGYKSPGKVYVEGDASSASYFLAAGAISGLTGGGPVRVEGVGSSSIQGDVRFVDMLEQMGASVAIGEDWIEAGAGAASAAAGKLKAFDADCNAIPDAAMTLVVAALFADGRSVIRNIASWRVKETDRIAAMAREIRKFGAIAEEGQDYIAITPPHRLPMQEIVTVDTYDDHRMAMCFSLVAFGGVPVRIKDPGCVAKTFPSFFDALKQISAFGTGR